MVISAIALVSLSGSVQTVSLVVSLAGFVVFFAFGVGGTGWIIDGEYFPTEDPRAAGGYCGVC
jgi:hypothetical protein